MTLTALPAAVAARPEDGPAPGAQTQAVSAAEGARPLCVDLDGTLALQDTLHEVFWKALLRAPLGVVDALAAALTDRAEMKTRLAAIAAPEPALIAWRPALLEALRAEKAKGRRLVLATGAHQSVAEAVAAELDLFDEAIGSRDGVNLTGRNKAAALVERFGVKGFDYVGDSAKDLEVWPDAAEAWLAGDAISPGRVVEVAGAPVTRRFTEPRSGDLSDWLKAMRLYQWVKNGLVFIPALAAGALLDPGVFAAAAVAFLCFSLVASAGYLINDLVDLDSDRRHPRKRERPFAAGRIGVMSGAAGAVGLIAAGLIGAALLSGTLFIVLALYLGASFLYSFSLKRVAVFDVFTLAGLYCLRLFAGGVATDIELSVWLLSFSGFLFLSLGCLKRVGEMVGADAEAKTRGRGYQAGDAAPMAALGLSIGVASVIIFTLYINSPQAQAVYEAPGYLWGVAPFFLLWLSRLWLMAWRGKVRDDPILTVLRDPASWLLLLFGLTLLRFAHGPPEGLSWSDFNLGF
ncbi:MAG: UbiA family prenyltransferase [Pseudomonadota bacterium]